LLREVGREYECKARVTGVERVRNGVASLRQGFGHRPGKPGLRSD